ncbi:histidine-rich glycoprotein-like [Bactrocera tryoni]|uniref:histidine-rich glycoprotein-like n=1 Tax=Bactrocera tryoni TaxID=59916 RepID=UPI001A96EF20|nr:histidine-rich glycoprotein-like [Bactrocera tryoni]
MRTFGVCLVLVLFVAMLVGTSGNPVGDNVLTLETTDQPLTLSDVNDKQGHENEGDRLARDYGHHDGHHEKHHDGHHEKHDDWHDEKHHDGHHEKHHEKHQEKHHEKHHDKHHERHYDWQHGGHHG